MNEEKQIQEEKPSPATLQVTAEQLYSAQIGTRLLGYSKEEVDMLLEEAAATIEMLRLEKKGLLEKVEDLEKELEKYQDMESSLRASLISSQKMGEAMIDSARLQADAIVEEARVARERALFKMEQLTPELQAEIGQLGAARDQLRLDLTAILKAHEALIDAIPRAETKEAPTESNQAKGKSTAPAKKDTPPSSPKKSTSSSSAHTGEDTDSDQENNNAYVDL